MYIEHKEYLALLDQIEYLKKDTVLLRQQNNILTQELLKQRQIRLDLEQDHDKNMRLIQQLHCKTISHQADNTKHIIERISQIDKERKDFLETKFTALEKSSYIQLKDLEIKNVKTRLDFYELNEFANKLKKMYKETQNVESGKNKKQPSLMDLLKWIKSIPGVAVNLQKSFLSTSMSCSNMKKQSVKSSKLKQNRSMLNSSKQKSRLKVCQENQKACHCHCGQQKGGSQN